MSKFLKIFAPAGAGAAGVLTMAYVLADQFIVDVPAPIREAIAIKEAQAQEAADERAAEAEAAALAAAEAAAAGMAPSREGGYGLGREALPEEVAAWDIDVRPDGMGLPVGSGDVWTGEELWIEKCAACHGDFGEAVGRWPQIAGGRGTIDGEDPVKTVGSYWPYLSTAWDYVHRAMPFGEAQSLSDDEVYALVAYILYSNDIVGDDFTLSNENFTEVQMPNAENFFMDDREETEYPVFTGEPCMEACKESVEITGRAAILDVTPDDPTDDAPAEEVTEVAAEEETPAEEAPAEEATAEEAAEEPADALDPALVAEGEGVFRRCSSCHQIGDGAVNRTGPHLNGVIGRPAGVGEGFRYSNVMVEAGENGLVWDDAALAEFLANPRNYMSGTRMSFAGLRSDEEIAAVIAYLKANGG